MHWINSRQVIFKASISYREQWLESQGDTKECIGLTQDKSPSTHQSTLENSSWKVKVAQWNALAKLKTRHLQIINQL